MKTNCIKLLTKCSVFVGVFFLLSSCVSVPADFITETTQWTKPEIGDIATSFIGDTIIREGIKDVTDSIYLKNEHGSLGWTAYHPAGNYKYCGNEIVKEATGKHDRNGNMIYNSISAKKFRFSKEYTNGWSTVYPVIYKFPNGNVYLQVNTGLKKLKNEEYSDGKLSVESGYFFEQQLIYTGCEGSVLKFSYREFQNDMARAAFTVDATYNVSKDKILRFKNCSFEVIKVDNQSITYKLLSGFKSDN